MIGFALANGRKQFRRQKCVFRNINPVSSSHDEMLDEVCCAGRQPKFKASITLDRGFHSRVQVNPDIFNASGKPTRPRRANTPPGNGNWGTPWQRPKIRTLNLEFPCKCVAIERPYGPAPTIAGVSRIKSKVFQAVESGARETVGRTDI